jgi:hypothetical protein
MRQNNPILCFNRFVYLDINGNFRMVGAVMRKTKHVVQLKVKELAEQQKLSEWDLVARSGLDVRVVRRMIANQGVHQMLVSQLAKMAEGLQVPVRELIDDNFNQ